MFKAVNSVDSTGVPVMVYGDGNSVPECVTPDDWRRKWTLLLIGISLHRLNHVRGREDIQMRHSVYKFITEIINAQLYGIRKKYTSVSENKTALPEFFFSEWQRN